jgi:hypothetical protein
MGIPRRLAAPSAALWKSVSQIGIAGILIGAVVTCHYERQNARDAGVQTYNLSRIAAFRDSGGKLDRAVAAFNDAMSGKGDISATRGALQTAMAEHASVVQAMVDVFGADGLASYMTSLKALNTAVQQCENPTGLPAIIRAMAANIMLRERLASAASARSLP